MTRPEVSAIIPCYNQGKYLEQTIRCLLKQTSKISEIIIVDDGSNDPHTLKVLTKVSKGKKIQLITTENKGPGAARNTGFTHASGKYIMLIDSDDGVHPSFLKKALRILTDFPLIGAVSSWVLCFGDEEYVWYPNGGALTDFKNHIACPSFAVIRRQAWLDAKGFSEHFPIGYEDWDFWIGVTKQNWLVYIIPELLFYYLQKTQSRVKNTFAKHREIYGMIMANHPDVFFTQKFSNPSS